MTVSIVMPAYNAERYIAESIRSVLAQTFADWELLVIDDGSADDTAAIVQRQAAEDERIRFLKNDRNRGVSATRSRGVREARGEWIAFLDSDDLWLPEKLERQLALAEIHPDAALTYTASAFMNTDGKRYSYVLKVPPELSFRGLLRHNYLSCSSVMAKRDLLTRYPFPGDEMHEDLAVWLQILREIPRAYGVNEPLLVYRLSGSSKSASRFKSAVMLYRTYRFVGFDPLRAGAMLLPYTLYSVNKRRKISLSADG